MRPLLLLFFISLTVLHTAAQDREEEPVPEGPVIQINNNRIVGKILDSRTHKGLGNINVQLYAYIPGDSAAKDSLVSGTFTRSNGDFSFGQLPPADSFRLVVSGIGFQNLEQTVVPSRTGDEATVTDLGNIVLEQQAQELANVVITARQRPALQMGIDRKVFSVERSLTATGGTALDVMRNIPSVSVDVEGNVQLRNAQPQIFVDGRPTVLTLDQIPADQIDRVELITNPSAKFDASSSAGIINVVMKRNRRIGLNGVATAGVGHPGILNGNLALNARQGKFNFFVSGGYFQSGGRANGKTLRQNKKGGVVDNYFNQLSWTERRRRFSSLRFGLDFFATNRTTLSATQNIVDGKFSNDEEQEQEYLNSNRILERTGHRNAEENRHFNRYSTQLNFTHRFPEQGKEISANVNYNYGKGSEAAHILNAFFYPNGMPYGSPARVRNEGRNSNDQYIFQIDYVDPAGEDAKLEAGVRSFINKQESFFSSFSVDNGAETLLPLSNNYAYSETVNAAYASWSNRVKSFSYQVGLRAEISRFEGRLIDSAKTFGYDYPSGFDHFFDALFPSVFLTQKLSEDAEIQLNYSRRIRRPNFWQLNPFIDINDPMNLRQGNPELRPEFTNSFEFNYSQNYAKGNFLGVIYYRNNLGDITRYSDTISTALYRQLNNAAIDPNAILNTFINARSTNRLGAEFTLQHRFNERFDVVPTVDMQYRKVNADVGTLRLSNSGFSWEGKLTMNYKLANVKSDLLNNLGFQLMGEYESREVTAQGYNKPQYRVDFALRKDFLKDNKASFTFNINDVFNSYRYINIYDTEAFYQESVRRRNVRNFRITFTYKFGKQDFRLFRRPDNSNGGWNEE